MAAASSGLLDLRFVAPNADIQVGDVLVTSGLDGVYPAGLAVAKVMQVEKLAAGAFGRVVCQPLAGIDRNRQLLIVMSTVARTAPAERCRRAGAADLPKMTVPTPPWPPAGRRDAAAATPSPPLPAPARAGRRRAGRRARPPRRTAHEPLRTTSCCRSARCSSRSA